jgi:uncharacterized membrane protein
MSREQLIEMHQEVSRQVALLGHKMAAVSSILLGLAEGYDQLRRCASFGRVGRARQIDFLIQVTSTSQTRIENINKKISENFVIFFILCYFRRLGL